MSAKNPALNILEARLKKLTEEKRDTDYTVSDSRQAAEMGINYNTFYKYLNGTAACPAHNLLKIADYYGVSTDYLLGRTNVRTLDTDIKAACDYTGLSQNAVKILHKYRHDGGYTRELDLTAFMIEGGFFEKIAVWVNRCIKNKKEREKIKCEILPDLNKKWAEARTNRNREIEDTAFNLIEFYENSLSEHAMAYSGAFMACYNITGPLLQEYIDIIEPDGKDISI